MHGKVKRIVNKIMKHIKKLDNNTKITTYQLCRDVGYDDNDCLDMLNIDYTLWQYCCRAGILLDSSEFDGQTLGLPYNLPFIIKKIGKNNFQSEYAKYINR